MPPGNGVRTALTFTVNNPQWNSAFQPSAGYFSPGLPATPSVQNAVRLLDFNVGQNTLITPRTPELVSFRELKAYSNIELIRLAIETRKDQLERQQWQITPVDPEAKRAARKGKPDARIANVTKFWTRPDGVNHFSTWLRLLADDLLVIDALTLERRRDRAGRLIGLDPVQGDTIKVLVDETGRRPQAPLPGFEQIIKGVVWNTLTSKDIIYAPRNVRPGKLYGLSPVEQIIVTANTLMRRQAAQLGYFTEGNIPAGMINAPAGWGADAIATMQASWDMRNEGDPTKSSKLKWVPEGSKYTAFKESPLKDDFDEWLARVVAFAFSLPPTPFIKQMNRSTGETDQDRALEEGLEPLKLYFKRLFDIEIQEELGCPDLEFDWVDTPSIDPKIQSDIDDKNLRNGSATINEVRDARGLDPLEGDLGNTPLLYVSTGAVTLEQVLKASEDAMAPPKPIAGLDESDPGVAVGDSGAPVEPDAEQPDDAEKPPAKPGANPKAKPAEKLAKASDPASPDRPLARRAGASIRKGLIPILTRCGDEAAGEVAKGLKAMGKAADDADIDKQAQEIAAVVDLSALDDVSALIFDPLYDVVQDAAAATAGGVGVDLTSVGLGTGDGMTGQVYQAAVDYARKRAADLVSVDGEMNIVNSTRDMIRQIVADGLKNNIGSKAIADNIQAATAFSKERAETIATNEIRMANATGKFNGWKEGQALGLELQKKWQTSSFYHCCDACGANEDAGWIDLDDPFPSGAMNEAESHVNCRCVTISRVKKPTPKP